MLKFNTQANILSRLFSHEQVFKAVPPLPNGLKTGFMAVLLCCLFSSNLEAQCDIVCPANPDYDLSLNVMGQATLDPTVFEPLVSSSFTQCLPVNGGVLEIWEDAAGTVPYPTALPGPNFDCTDIGVSFSVYVTLNDPGPGVQSPTCMFNIEIVDNVVPIIFPPGSITVTTGSGTSCASVQTLTATVADNCTGNLTLDHVLTGATTGTFPGFTATHAFNEGVTTITWRVDDGVNPVFTSTTTVTVLDVEDPQFVGALPADITLSANGSCEAGHTFFIPNVSDNCGVSNTGPSEYEMTLNFPAGYGAPYNDMVIDVHPGGVNSAVEYPASLFPLGTTTVTLDVVDDNGNSNSHSFDITVEDNTPPTFAAAPTSVSVATVTCTAPVTLMRSATDNCDPSVDISFTVSPSVGVVLNNPAQDNGDAGGVYPVGIYTITFTATDNASPVNPSTHTVTLTVSDNVAPTAACAPFTAPLDASGNVTVDAQSLDDGSSDNCNVLDYFFYTGGFNDVATQSYNCSDVGTPINVEMYVTDGANNSGTCSTTITVVDNVLPTAQCQPVSLDLPPAGTVTLTTAQLNNASSDACGIFSYSLGTPFVACGTALEGDPLTWSTPVPMGAVYSRVIFASYGTPNGDCANGFTIGACHATDSEMVVDNLLGMGSPITADNATFGDPCSGTPKYLYVMAEYIFPSMDFDCSDVGSHTVALTVTDNNGNANSCSATVTINDVTPPTPVCNPVTIELDGNGEASVNDLSPVTTTFSAVGMPVAIADNTTTTHTLTVGSDITISDLDVDLEITHTWTGDLDVTLESPSGTVVSLFDRPGTTGVGSGCSDDNLMVYFDDESANTAMDLENTCEDSPPATYAISGDFQPIDPLSAFDGENAMGDWTLTVNDNAAGDAGQIENWSLIVSESFISLMGAGTMDDCGTVSWTIDPENFTCADLGSNTYTLTATDGSNTVTCMSTVTIEDNIDPNIDPLVICPTTPFEVYLDATGNVDVPASIFSPVIDDNCTVVEIAIQKQGFFGPFGPWSNTLPGNALSYDCGGVNPAPPFFDGLHDVRVWARDQSNNPSVTPSLATSTLCTDAINVIDNVPPAAGCVDLSVAVGPSGDVLVTAFQLALSSSDNCTGTLALTREMSVDTDGDGNGDTPWSADYVFDCDDILTNANLVEVRVTDGNGNSSICTSEVTIEDNEDPVITCPADMTIDCSADDTPAALGMASGTDNCAMPPTVQPHSDAISNMVCTGTYRITRTWTVEDDYGNTASCDQIIEVEDNAAPTFAAPADITLECPDSYQVANFECQDLTSNDPDLPINISDNMPNTITSELPVTVPYDGKITEVKVNLQAAHTRVPDLKATLNFTPQGAIVPSVSVVLFDGICGASDMNVDLMLMDGGGVIPCPPTNQSMYFEPDGSLSAFIGQKMNGTWRLVIEDSDPAPNGGGQLLGWGLEICFVPQAMELTLTGDVTAVDDCGIATETPTDYMAFKDFDDNLDFPRPSSDYDFEHSTWVGTHPGLTGTTPTTLSLTSLNSGAGGMVNYSHTIPAVGFVGFDWSYTTNDPNGATADPFFINNGIGDVMIHPGSGASSGRALIPVIPGSFTFSQRSTNGLNGSATVTIENFVYVNTSLCPLPANLCPREFCIARIWNVVDDCGNAADPQLQIINTGDTNGPSFGAAPTTMTVIAPPGICTPDVTIDLSSFIDDGGCSDYDNLTLWNSALGDFGTGDEMADASGFYAPGIYVIDFEATDECGNTSYHTLTLEVIDDQDPDAKCVDYTVQLNNMGEATVLLADVDNGSLDNCPGMTLSFAAPPAAQVPTILLTTADIGQTPITLYAVDASGNMSSCVSVVTVLGGVLVDAEDVAGTTGSTVQVPVVTNDEFFDIGSFSAKVEIVDGSVATLGAGGVTIHPDLAALGGTLLFNPLSATEVMVSWISPNPFGSTLIPPNTGLFLVEADLIGAAGTSTPVQIEDDVVNRIISGVSTTVPSFGLAGTISVLNTGTMFTVGGPLTEAAICGGDDIHLVDVELTGAPSTPASPIVNAAGSYSFDVPQGSTVTITPTKDMNWFDGSVDIFDVLLVNQHFLGIPPLLDSPYKILAADINRNNTVDIADVFAINQVGLGNLPAGLGDPWGFVNDDHAFADPFNPWSAPVPSSITLVNVQADDANVGFYGYHLGDVDCSADPTLFTGGPVTDGNTGELPFVALDQAVAAGETFTVDFNAQAFADYIGYQTSIQFNAQAIEFVEFLPSANLTNLTVNNFNANGAAEGILATNWYNLEGVTLNDGETVFSIKFKALQNASSLASLLDFNGELIEGKAIKANGTAHGVDLVFESLTSANEVNANSFALYQNTPNPFGFTTKIGFKLPESAKATLTISDASGRVLKVIDGTYSAGYHQVSINRDDLTANGVLLYRLETATHTAVRKMILLD